ncbi:MULTISPECIES: YvaD family protein [unclassified Clostridium]|uniref:YvaD family protein n=1 Tax=unclassified Clostridium TaxID=2614128 RepID=UPI00029868A6|nr:MULTISPECIES: YvaD family protein [unclassified Clostridium]EKQ52265.1 MAG: hypothetical protein A370_04427 [Clostridium sp. Maddingley MBC34-26]
MKILKNFFLVTDIGFVVYWFITLFHLIPEELLFKDYKNPILVSWNWSFIPLDLLISLTGFLSLYLYYRKNTLWKRLSIISLVLTFCSGLQAISFWSIRYDFDFLWWIFNLYLIIYPLFFIKNLLTERLE